MNAKVCNHGAPLSLLSQKHYPQLLNPTKERKIRNRQNSKFKPQKARGKMNQDGKGGRSANTT